MIILGLQRGNKSQCESYDTAGFMRCACVCVYDAYIVVSIAHAMSSPSDIHLSLELATLVLY